jgi:hypothetical protein
MAVLRRLLATSYADNAAMEQIVAASGLDWTIVRLNRLNRLTNKAATGAVHTSRGLLERPRALARADAAATLLDILADTTLARTAINVSGGKARSRLPPRQRPEAGQRAGQLQQPQQDVAAALVADLQAPVAHQPRQRPLHHIPVAAQPLGGLDATPGDPRADPAPTQHPPAARVVVVGSGRSAAPCFRDGPFLRPAPPNPPCALPRNGLSTSSRQWAHAGDPCRPLAHGVGILAPR